MPGTGEHYERIALNYLIRRGLKHVTSNYTCRKGEIDHIMMDKDTLVFVEVRFRKKNTHGSAAESITTSKKRKIICAAQSYLQSRQLWHLDARFDVVAIDGKNRWYHRDSIHWFPSAFSPEP